MTREEAIKGLKVLYKDFSGHKPNEEIFDMAIKALEQEPCEDAVNRHTVLDLIQIRMGAKELYKAVYDLPSVTPARIETVTEFADRCMECGNEYGKQLKQLERIKERYAEERVILLNSNSEYTTNNVLDIIDYIIHGD